MRKLKINSLVTRISHNHDVIFRVINIIDNEAILQGEIYRLVADAPLTDLKDYEVKNKIILSLPTLKFDAKLLKGKVLHLDGDEFYLKKAMEAYRNYHIDADGYFIKESDMPKFINQLVNKHRPDILVITGHDSIIKGQNIKDINSYRNSKYFVESVKIARSIIKSKDELVIIAGACQSYYEALIQEGANFASSPNRKNIHLLDPVIVASSIASTTISEEIDFKKVLQNTYSKQIGGIETKGRARKYYLGGS